jgi:molybdate transport system substrate-binding protein
MKRFSRVFALSLVAILCSLSPSAWGGEIHVAAAQSLRDVVDELADGYQKTHPGVTIHRNYGSSGTLARQIEAGAAGDIFLSANRKWMTLLEEKKSVDSGSVSTFIFNTLVFAGQKNVRAGGMAELPGLQRVAIGSPKSAPAGEYAVQAMTRAGIAGQMEKKLVMARDVREALLYAERGEVDGAFVYRTDALRSRKVAVLFDVPQELYDRVEYPAALTASGAGKPEASEFFAWLRSDEAASVLERHGFATR